MLTIVCYSAFAAADVTPMPDMLLWLLLHDDAIAASFFSARQILIAIAIIYADAAAAFIAAHYCRLFTLIYLRCRFHEPLII